MITMPTSATTTVGYNPREQPPRAAVATAWAAGLFEGEGSISIHDDGRRASVRAALGMTDFDVVDRFHETMGVGSCHVDPRARFENEKPQRIWRASGSEAIYVVASLLPHFGARRRARAIEAIDWFLDRFLIVCGGCGVRAIVGKTSGRHCSARCAHRVRRHGPTRTVSAHGLVVRTELSTKRTKHAERLAELLEEYAS